MATFRLVAIAVLAVCAVLFLVSAVLAERRRSASATVLRCLGAICAALAAAAYAIPTALLAS